MISFENAFGRPISDYYPAPSSGPSKNYVPAILIAALIIGASVVYVKVMEERRDTK